MSIYLINNIIVPLEEEADFRRETLRALRCKGSDLLKVDIYRKSVDARKKENIIFVANQTRQSELESLFALSHRVDIRMAERYILF